MRRDSLRKPEAGTFTAVSPELQTDIEVFENIEQTLEQMLVTLRNIDLRLIELLDLAQRKSNAYNEEPAEGRSKFSKKPKSDHMPR